MSTARLRCKRLPLFGDSALQLVQVLLVTTLDLGRNGLLLLELFHNPRVFLTERRKDSLSFLDDTFKFACILNIGHNVYEQNTRIHIH